MSSHPAQALERLVGEGTDADEVLRTTVGALAREPGVSWAGIAFLEDGELTPGPSAGIPDEARRTSVPIAFRGAFVGELAADGDVDAGLLERIATLISAYVLIGWDTGGETWEP
jgi:hypothetical protein